MATSKIKYIVNISTPETPEELKSIQKFLDANEGRMFKNDIYDWVAKSIAEGQMWKRSGYSFMLFFTDKEAASAFALDDSVLSWTHATIQKPLEKS